MRSRQGSARPAGSRQRLRTPPFGSREGHLCMQGEVWPGGFHGENVFTIAEPAGCDASLERGPPVSSRRSGPGNRRVLNFTHTPENSLGTLAWGMAGTASVLSPEQGRPAPGQPALPWVSAYRRTVGDDGCAHRPARALGGREGCAHSSVAIPSAGSSTLPLQCPPPARCRGHIVPVLTELLLLRGGQAGHRPTCVARSPSEET